MKKGEQYYQPQPTPQIPEPVLVAPEREPVYYASGPVVAQKKTIPPVMGMGALVEQRNSPSPRGYQNLDPDGVLIPLA